VFFGSGWTNTSLNKLGDKESFMFLKLQWIPNIKYVTGAAWLYFIQEGKFLRSFGYFKFASYNGLYGTFDVYYVR
jgi:hypothetical protein